MSNFSKTFAAYLRGYLGSNALAMFETQRELSAAALGVYHRTTLKPPLMSSVAVTAELKLLQDPHLIKASAPRKGNLVFVAPGDNKIAAIKAIREIVPLDLREAKRIVDKSLSFKGSPGSSTKILENQPDRVEAAAKLLRDAGCVIEVS